MNKGKGFVRGYARPVDEFLEGNTPGIITRKNAVYINVPHWDNLKNGCTYRIRTKHTRLSESQYFVIPYKTSSELEAISKSKMGITENMVYIQVQQVGTELQATVLDIVNDCHLPTVYNEL